MRNAEGTRPFKEDLALFLRALRILWKISPRYMVWQVVSGIVEAVTPFFGVYMSARIVNELAGARDKNTLFTLAVVTLLGGFLISVVSRVVRARQTVWKQNSWRNEDLFFMDVQNGMQYNHLENPEVSLLRERISSVKQANGSGLMKVQWSIQNLIRHLACIITSLALSVTILTSKASGELHGFLAFANTPFSVLSLTVLVAIESWLLIRIKNDCSEKTAKEGEALSKYNTVASAYRTAWSSDTTIFGMKKIILPELAKVLVRPQYAVNGNRINLRCNIQTTIIRTLVDLWLYAVPLCPTNIN